jgi:hypothetical protein
MREQINFLIEEVKQAKASKEGKPKEPAFDAQVGLSDHLVGKVWRYKEVSKAKIREWAPRMYWNYEISWIAFFHFVLVMSIGYFVALSHEDFDLEDHFHQLIYLPLITLTCIFIACWRLWFRFIKGLKYKSHVWTTLRVLEAQKSMSDFAWTQDVDQRPDLLAMSDLKHKNAGLYWMEFFRERYRPWADLNSEEYCTRYDGMLPLETIYRVYRTTRRIIVRIVCWWYGYSVREEKSRKRTRILVSSELLMQVLAQPVCKLNATEETTWLRINQSLSSLHTVNEDRRNVLIKQRMTRQETAVVANFIFKCEAQELRNVPFPRPH